MAPPAMNDLSPERWQQIDDLFVEVLDRPPDERTAFLRHVCGDDPALYREVVALLDHAEAAEQTLGESVTQYAAPLLAHLKADLRAHPAEHLPGNGDIGPYRLVREIGHGGMGAVYLAERADGAFEQTVALKLVKRGMDTDEILRRFRHERQILASLQHPHIAQLYDGGVASDGRPYLVMEYVEGTPIHRFCDAHTLPVDRRLELFEAVCEAVQYAHQNLVVHRDLKPSNILVTEEGQVKLLDFGIAKLLSDDAVGLTRTGVRLLTPQYASPEQMTGEAVTTATDVYALGVILYELLTGHRPFENHQASASPPSTAEPERPSTAILQPAERQRPDGTTETITPEATSAARATHPSGLQRRLRGDLDTIVLKALRSEPERRYASADAFLDDIKRHLGGLPVAARPASLGYRASKFIQRHRVGVAMAGLMAALLVGFVIVYTVRITQERDIARQERDKAEEVSAFLENLLAASDPAHGTNRADTLRVRDFLEKSVPKIQQELASQPAVQAQMLHVLGNVHRNLGLYSEAQPLLEQALDMRRQLFGAEHPEVAESMLILGVLFRQQNEFDAADSLLRETLALRQQLYGEQHAEVAQSLSALAAVLLEKGALDEAEGLYRQALAIRRQHAAEAPADLAHGLIDLAALLQRKGMLDEAEDLHREALTLLDDALGEHHPLVATNANNLALLLIEKGELAAAEPLARKALAIRRTLYGEEHPVVATSLNNLASLLADQGKLDEAEQFYRESIALRRKLFGEQSPEIGVALNNLAALVRDKGDLDEAQRLYQEAISIMQQALGPDHPAVGIMTSNLANIFRRQGMLDTAIAHYRAALGILEQKLPPDHPSLARTRIGLGECFTERGAYREAEALILEGYATLTDKGSNPQPALEGLVALYKAWGKPDEVAEYQTLLASTDS